MSRELKTIIVFTALCLTNPLSSFAAQDLLALYEQALTSDPILKQAEANRLAVGEIENQSIARLLPNVSLSASHSRNRLYNKRFTFQGAGEQNFWNSGFELTLTQPVFRWEDWVRLDQSANQIAQAEAEYQAEEQNLMVRVAEAYFNVLAALDDLQFTQMEKTAIGRQLEQAQARFEVGLIAITDINEAQAAFDRASAEEIAAQNAVDNSKERLREIVGDVVGDEFAILDSELPLNRPDPSDIEAWGRLAENQNLRIVASFNQAEVARKTIEVHQSGHYPSLDIVGAYSMTDNNSTFGLRGDQQRIGVELNIPLFAGGEVSSRIRQAQYQHEQAKEKLNETRRAVIRMTKDAYRGVLTSISRVQALKTAVVSAESALEATDAGFEVGTRTMVDVLKSQRDLYQARRNWARSRYDYLINGLKLKQAASTLTAQDIAALNQLLRTNPPSTSQATD